MSRVRKGIGRGISAPLAVWITLVASCGRFLAHADATGGVGEHEIIGAATPSGATDFSNAAFEPRRLVTAVDTTAKLRTAVSAFCTNPATATTTYGAIQDWDVSLVIDFGSLFRTYCSSSALATFNSDISRWDTSKATSLYYAWMNAASFNQPVAIWDVSNVNNMYRTWTNCEVFNQNLVVWDVSKVTAMYRLFSVTQFNYDITTWNIGKVTTMLYMFEGNMAFAQILCWDLTLVTGGMPTFEAGGVVPPSSPQCACTPGKYWGGSVCSNCAAGKWSAAHYLTCSNCAAGRYEASTGKSSCSACAAGKTSIAASTSSTACTACIAGKYANVPGSATCISCAAGNYGATSGATVCSVCPIGFYSGSAALSCTACAAGRYALASGTATCAACAAGTYSALTGRTSACTDLCQPGMYSSSQAVACTNCAAARYTSLAGSSTCNLCDLGKYSLTGATSCTACTAGKYKADNVGSSCADCSAGTYSSVTGKAEACADACPAGKGSAAGSASCSNCPAGTYSVCTNCVACVDIDGNPIPCQGRVCTSCALGTASASTGLSTQCPACSAGSFAASAGLSACAACPAGQSQPATAQISCVGCSPGTYQDTTGEASCKECLAGKYSTTTGLAGGCPSCSLGQYSAAGATGCTLCAAGHFTPSTGATECVQTPRPLPQPTAKPSQKPTLRPTSHPTIGPTAKPTPEPTATYAPSNGTPKPTMMPLPAPSPVPVPPPTAMPTLEPTPNPTSEPTLRPTPKPTPGPVPVPSPQPIPRPTPEPTVEPSPKPTPKPTLQPTPAPTTSDHRSKAPTTLPTAADTVRMKVEVFLSPTTSALACTKAAARQAFDGRLGGADTDREGTVRDFTVVIAPSSGGRRRLQAAGLVEFFVYASLDQLGYDDAPAWIAAASKTLTSSKASISSAWSVACGCTVSITAVSASAADVFPTAQPTSSPKPTPRPPGKGLGVVVPAAAAAATAASASASTLMLLVAGVALAVVLLAGAAVACRAPRKEGADKPPRVGVSVLVSQANGGRALMVVKRVEKSTGVISLDPAPGSKADVEAMHITLVEFRAIVEGATCVAVDVAPSGLFAPGTSGAVEMMPAKRQAAGEGGGGLAGAHTISRKDLAMEAEPFAAGGGGQIFKGRYMGHDVAIKQVFASSVDARLDFEREVAMLCKLSHPSIVTLYGISSPDGETVTAAGKGGGAMYMVLEFCGGGDLSGYYKKRAFTNLEFVRVVTEVLGAVCYLHGRSIAHRDLKPANVLLQAGSMHVRVADFGLAKNHSRNTVTAGVGTPAYMPPEVLASDEAAFSQVDIFAVDMYALGVICGQLWAKQAPFEGIGVHRVITAAMEGKRPGLEPGTGGIPPTHPPLPGALLSLVERCWHQDPAKRPTADECARCFEVDVAPAVKSLPVDIGDRSLDALAAASTAKGAAAAARSKAGAKAAAVAGGAAATEALVALLRACGPEFESFAPALARAGFGDVEEACDKELLDDDTLLKVVGMTKVEVRKFRATVTKSDSTPTIVKKRKEQDKAAKQDPGLAKQATAARLPGALDLDQAAGVGEGAGTAI